METWLLLTAYRKSLTPYPKVQSPPLYDLPFSHIVGLLHDFQILYTDVQIFKLGSHYVLKIQAY